MGWNSGGSGDSHKASQLLPASKDSNSNGTLDERCPSTAWGEEPPPLGSLQQIQAMMQPSRPSSRPGSGSGSTHPLCPLDAAVAAAAEASRGAALILAEGAAQSSGSHLLHCNMIRQPLTRTKRNSSPGQLLPPDAGSGNLSNAAGSDNTGPISAISAAASLDTVSGAADQTDVSLLTVEALRAELEAMRAAAAEEEERWRAVCSSLQAEIDEVRL